MAKLKSKRIVTKGDRGKMITGGIWAVTILAVFFTVWAQNNMLTTAKITHQVDKLPKSLVGFKIVHISDFSNSSINVVNEVSKAEPDVIILSGGYCDPATGDANITLGQVQQLATIAPTYYIYNGTDVAFYGDQDYLSGTGAENVTDTFATVSAAEISASDFIRKNYGDGIANKINKSVNEYNAFIQQGGSLEDLDEDTKNNVEYYLYVQSELKETAGEGVRIIGLAPEYPNSEDDAFSIVGEITKAGPAGFDAAILGDPTMANTVSRSQVKGIFSGGTYGTDWYSDIYKKGTYGLGTSTLFISGGIGLNKDITHLGGIKTRVFNFPQIQCITLSDGTIYNKNPLEKFLDNFVPNVSTVWDNDGGFATE